MTFRNRILLSTLPVVLIPLVVFGLGVRRAVRQRLAAQYTSRVAGLMDAIGQDLARQGTVLATRLARLREAAAADNRFRLAAVSASGADRAYLLDYAGTAMHLAGLDMLQIQDDSGRIVSSGQFRNEFDRRESALPRLVPTAPNGLALVTARAPDGPFVALARVDSLPLGDRLFTVVGGTAVDSGFLARLARDSALTVALAVPGDTVSTRPAAGIPLAGPEEAVSELPVPYVQEGASDSATSSLVAARLVVAAPLAGLREVQHTVDVWFGGAVLGTLLVTILLAGWLASRLSLPLAELAAKTTEVEMNGSNAVFASDRDDEIGSLERLLGAMTDRLRSSAARLRDAERHAALGELARQVNHDIKNGLAPLRNVLRHLAGVARDRPAELPRVFAERRQTLASSLSYLETLAANYAKLSPTADAQAVDVNAVTRETVGQLPLGAAELSLQLADGAGAARIDPLALRRILENLVSNAVDSLGGQSGMVTVSSARLAEANQPVQVRLVVEDTGTGMTEAELERAFQDFYSTKPGGTGLGLSIVRRLVTDAGGRLRVETSPGAGSRFIVDLPAIQGGPA
jgi:two-component system nitrogen regulation sensor histidine kinase NtrY